MPEQITLTRAELYEKVWTVPMRTLAKQFGLSDVGLAKLCRRHEIPLPDVGHWRLVETGRAPERKPLSLLKPGQSEIIVIAAREPKPYELPKKADLKPVPNVRVEDDQEITHPLSVRTKRAFQPTSKDEQGRYVPLELKAAHLRVSANSLPRALRILDGLFHAAELQSHSVSWVADSGADLKIAVNGEELRPYLSEYFSRNPHSLTPDEIARKKKNLYVFAPQWDYTPSGRLRLSIENLPCELRHLRKSWSDGKTQRVENCLGDCLAVLPHIAKAIKLVNEERERDRIQREEERKQAEEKRLKQEEYDRRAKVAEQFLEAREKSKGFRDLAISIEKRVEGSSILGKQKEEIRAMARWIARHAENIDPVTDWEWMIQEFTDPPWKYKW